MPLSFVWVNLTQFWLKRTFSNGFAYRVLFIKSQPLSHLSLGSLVVKSIQLKTQFWSNFWSIKGGIDSLNLMNFDFGNDFEFIFMIILVALLLKWTIGHFWTHPITGLKFIASKLVDLRLNSLRNPKSSNFGKILWSCFSASKSAPKNEISKKRWKTRSQNFSKIRTFRIY